jgi:signal peptidase II
MTGANPKLVAGCAGTGLLPSSTVWWIVGLILGLDVVLKSWVHQQLDYLQVIAVTPFFNLVHVHNTGAAFSFLADAGGWQRWFFVGVAATVSIGLAWLLAKSPNWVERLALAVLLGGALGNLTDRLYRGYVVDYLDLHWQGWHWPAFNLADMAICTGVALLLWLSFRTSATIDVKSA